MADNLTDTSTYVTDAATNTLYVTEANTMQEQKLDITLHVLSSVLLLIIIVLVLMANIIVIVAIGKHDYLRTLSNTFILSLGVADLLVGLLVMIPAMFNQVMEKWIFPETFCTVWIAFDVMLCSGSILSVCLISIDRYLLIMNPLKYKTFMTPFKVVACITAVWVITAFSSFLPIFNGWHRRENTFSDIVAGQCVLQTSLTFALTASFLTILVPIIVTTMLYGAIFKAARRHARLIHAVNALIWHKRPKNIVSTTKDVFSSKASFTLGILLGAFVITWLPFFTVNLIDASCECVDSTLFSFIVWLGYCNSLINAIIYPLLMKNFRYAYGKMFPCLKRIEIFQANIHPTFSSRTKASVRNMELLSMDGSRRGSVIDNYKVNTRHGVFNTESVVKQWKLHTKNKNIC
ncbi:unnamed protein product [Owenia fusiformis]|uniref:Uncharacterized protein n=1 Tax=Owenia fusiformis TaxID=6347 RepID=A0A8J1UVM3_OWEFU|nr:unnamed protein product [Owenia fusiformis]